MKSAKRIKRLIGIYQFDASWSPHSLHRSSCLFVARSKHALKNDYISHIKGFISDIAHKTTKCYNEHRYWQRQLSLPPDQFADSHVQTALNLFWESSDDEWNNTTFPLTANRYVKIKRVTEKMCFLCFENGLSWFLLLRLQAATANTK